MLCTFLHKRSTNISNTEKLKNVWWGAWEMTLCFTLCTNIFHPAALQLISRFSLQILINFIFSTFGIRENRCFLATALIFPRPNFDFPSFGYVSTIWHIKVVRQSVCISRQLSKQRIRDIAVKVLTFESTTTSACTATTTTPKVLSLFESQSKNDNSKMIGKLMGSCFCCLNR